MGRQGGARSPGKWPRRADDKPAALRRTGPRRTEVTTTDPRNEALIEAACAALRPYQWRKFTPELLGRLLLATSDRQRVHGLLAGVPGSAVGQWNTLEPADRHDVRLSVLVGFLVAHRWSELSLPVLCRELLALLEDET
jgi:hypothetical protein